MSTPHLQNLLNQGIDAAQQGDRQKAQFIFEAVIAADEENVAAWWWLAQVLDDPKAKSKCLYKARAAAAESDADLALYRSLLEKSRAPRLTRYKLIHNSRSLGDTCPVCTTNFTVNDVVVHCPGCQRAHHDECWKENVYHCGNFACTGEALIRTDGLPAKEAPASKTSLSISPEEIPEETPWETREVKEAGFVKELQKKIIAQVFRDTLMEEIGRAQEWERAVQEQRRRQEEQRNRELITKIAYGFLLGLMPGIILAYFFWPATRNWFVAIFSVYLVATGISVSVGHYITADDKFISIIYWLIPRVVSAIILYISYLRYKNGIYSIIYAYFVGNFIVTQFLRMNIIYNNKSLIVISIITIIFFAIIRFYVY